MDVSSLVDVHALSEIILVAIGLLILLTSNRIKRTLTTIRSNSSKYLVIYYLVCLVSVFWSHFWSYTIFRAVEMITVIILIFVCMNYYQKFISAERAYILISFIIVLFGLFMHFRLGSSQLSLSKLHTNQYSAIAAMAFVYCFGEWFHSEIPRRKLLAKLGLLFCFLTALGTSATSNIAAFCGVLVVLALSRRSNVLIISCMLLGLVTIYWLGYLEEFWMDVLFPGKSELDIITLKGRRHLWDIYLGLIAEQPILGYGFAAVSRMGHLWGNISTTNTHNGFLEVLLSTGLLGGSFFLMWLLRISKEMLHAYKCNRIGAVGAIGAFTVALINNLGRTMIGGSFDAPSIVFVILIALFAGHICVQAQSNVPMEHAVPVWQRRKGFLNVRPRALSRTIGKPR